MTDHIKNRQEILRALRGELVGPDPQGEPLDFSAPVAFEKVDESFGPWRQTDAGDEVLQRDSPTKRYGVGVLYPFATPVEGQEKRPVEWEMPGLASTVPQDPKEEQRAQALEEIRKRLDNAPSDPEPEAFDLSLANTFKPSSMGLSFLVDLSSDATLVVEAGGGRYYPTRVMVAGSERTWWLRKQIGLRAEFEAQSFRSVGRGAIPPARTQSNNAEHLDLRVEAYSRQYGENSSHFLVSVCLVNRTALTGTTDEAAFFQAGFTVHVVTAESRDAILPYPEQLAERLDEEEQSIALLYRKSQTYAVGHGCAADWDADPSVELARSVSAVCLPVYETPSVTPEIEGPNGEPVHVPMALLAGLVPGDDGISKLEAVVGYYEEWIREKEQQITELDSRYTGAARRHIAACKKCAVRMREGIRYLAADKIASRAFQLANRAILYQQLQSRTKPRLARYDGKTRRILFSGDYAEPDLQQPMGGRGQWRAFQIAFLLMAIESSVSPSHPDRKTVELIWFPTGGGKTEAYLGLAAFALFVRRLRNKGDDGTHVLMRYTLRLLTAQQFQRAARLICAMEVIRSEIPDELGSDPFTIGMWVGAANTPNTRRQALETLRALKKGDRGARNEFVLDRCPWCAAQLGPLDHKGRIPKDAPRVLGYVRQVDTVAFRCPDERCRFRTGLPVLVIDQDIYESPPSLVIGTVDKFAILAWRPEARAIFGIADDGGRVSSPPGLIIQDELHLISGPLGSLVGLYETAIEELCTDRRNSATVPPKIVSSTATIRRYADQIRSIYARPDVVLFPPPGLEQSDSFFARYSREPGGGLQPGRMYVGVNGPSLGSMQTVQVRTITALLQAPMQLPDAERDPWWTALVFFNSLRELGTTLSLLQSDIPDYQKVLHRRLARPSNWRHFWEIAELTGRASSEDIPKAISALEVAYPGEDVRPVDVCLASNILEVGVDIDRLSLMAVVGQPKTTSQYIQVTGRVGRSWWERPGLVVVMYGASKPRDRSHFEKFRSYHERLYANVEPTSVTPFSPPALDRGLHAVMALYARQSGDARLANSPYPFPSKALGNLREILLARVRAVDPAELLNFERVFDRRAAEWRDWESTRWSGDWEDEDIPLLRQAGAYAPPIAKLVSWPTPTSMRSVDAEAIAEIVLPPHREEPEDA